MNPSDASYTDSFVIICGVWCAISVAYGSYTDSFGSKNPRTNPGNRRTNPGNRRTNPAKRRTNPGFRRTNPTFANEPERTGCRRQAGSIALFQSVAEISCASPRVEVDELVAAGLELPIEPGPGLTMRQVSANIPKLITGAWARAAGCRFGKEARSEGPLGVAASVARGEPGGP